MIIQRVASRVRQAARRAILRATAAARAPRHQRGPAGGLAGLRRRAAGLP